MANELELKEEQKLAVAVELKEALKHIAKAMVLSAGFLAQNSENKIDDIVVPVLAPTAEAALLELIGKIKL